MKILLHKQFEKQYKKLPKPIKEQLRKRILLLVEDETHPLLHVHQLTGKKLQYESMNVNANYRALFTRSKTEFIFYEIGTHSELYS